MKICFLKPLVMILMQIVCIISSEKQLADQFFLSSSSGLIGDITEFINSGMSYNSVNLTITVKGKANGDLINGLKSPRQSVTLFYDTNLSILDDCWGKIHDVIWFVNSTLAVKRDATLIIALNYQSMSKPFESPRRKSKEHKKSTGAFNYLFLLQIPETTKCKEIDSQTISSTFDSVYDQVDPYTEIGISYPETLIDCFSLQKLLTLAYFKVIRFTFGDTPGVAESYSLFRRKIDSIARHNLKMVQNSPLRLVNTFDLPEFIYFPWANSSGEDLFYRRLFADYSERWLIEKQYQDGSVDTGFILPTVMSNNVSYTNKEFSLVPYIRPANAWLASAALIAITEKFNAIVLSIDIRLQYLLQGVSAEAFEQVIKQPDKDFRLEVIIDYSDVIYYDWNAEDWENEKNLIFERTENPDYPFKNMVLKALLFKLSITPDETFKVDADSSFLQEMSLKFIVGCRIFVNPLLERVDLENKTENIVESCIGINGTISVLYTGVLVSEDIDHMDYTDELRKHLIRLRNFRNSILNYHPEAVVYLEIQMFTDIGANQNNTVFCDPNVLRLNEYFEGVLNWAKFNDIPIILKSATDDLQTPVATSWLSYLRPIGDMALTRVVFPFFVMRNYPTEETINGWEVNPCITWTDERPEIPLNFFMNKFIATSFNPELIKTNFTMEDSTMMLRFIFHRFQNVEIVVGTYSGVITESLQKVINEGNITEKSVFLCFSVLPNIADNVKFINDSLSILLDAGGAVNRKMLNGIHLDFSKLNVVGNFQGDNGDYFSDQWELPSAVTNTLNVPIGIILNSTVCMGIYFSIAGNYPTDEVVDLIKAANYIVCNENLNVETQDDMETLGHIFDTHMYIKLAFEEVLPNLDIIFRVHLDVILNEDSGIMERYLRVLSHFKKFGFAYNIKYILGDAFDTAGETKNGWWAIKDYSDLTNPKTYVEKQSVYSGQQMTYPFISDEKQGDIPENNGGTEVTAIAMVFIPAIVLLAGIIVGIVCIRYRRLSKFLSDDEIKEFLNGRMLRQESHFGGDNLSAENMKFNPDYELSILDITCIDTNNLLGFGKFGRVYKGTVKGKVAAVKRPNLYCSKATFKTFLCEINIYCYLGSHQNIVNFIGAYIKEINKGVLCIATEYCTNGSLEGFLEKA
ncbi:unnamed protein product, partial [Orchesella dallaii]